MGHDFVAEGSDRSKRAACVREVHGEQHRGGKCASQCVPDLPSKIFRLALCRVAREVECHICWTCWDFGMGLGVEELLRIGLVIRGTVARRNFWSLCLPLQPIPLQKHLGRAQSIFAVDVRRGAEPRTSQRDISPCPCKR